MLLDSPARHTRSQTRSPSSSPVRMLNRTRTGLLSPPKSHRRKSPRKAKLDALPTIAEELPVTPPAKSALEGVKKRLFPERDSPNNPFLVSDDSPASSQDSVFGAGTSTAPVPAAPKKHVERPTLTYVLYVSNVPSITFSLLISCVLAEVFVKSLRIRCMTLVIQTQELHRAVVPTHLRTFLRSTQTSRQRTIVHRGCSFLKLARGANVVLLLTTISSSCSLKRLPRARARPGLRKFNPSARSRSGTRVTRRMKASFRFQRHLRLRHLLPRYAGMRLLRSLQRQSLPAVGGQ